MDSGFYCAFAGFSTRLDALDVLANNLANVNTPGYKAQVSFYRALPAWLQEKVGSPLNQVVNRFGTLAGAQINFSQGNLEATGNPTDVALDGDGFFTIQTKAGLRFTRSGAFRLNAQRQLVTQQGDLVLGEQKLGEIPKPIQLPTGELTISADGTVSVDGALLAKLRITEFAKDAALAPEGSTYFRAPDGSGKIATDAVMRQASLEASNSNPTKTMVSLIELQRTSQMMEKALSIFHNEFNRVASQDVPHI